MLRHNLRVILTCNSHCEYWILEFVTPSSSSLVVYKIRAASLDIICLVSQIYVKFLFQEGSHP